MNHGVAMLERQLQVLSRSYAATLPQRVARIESACLRSLAATPEAGSRRSLQQAVHDLKGSGGTFGFSAVSTAAGALERSIGVLDTEARPPTRGQLAELHSRIRALRTVADQVHSDGVRSGMQ